MMRNIGTEINLGNILFVLDPLDECEMSTQGRPIHALVDVERTTLKAPSSQRHSKKIVTSRPYAEIHRKFAPVR